MKEKLDGGLLIVLEGIDGTGKTTTATELCERLSTNYNVVLTREPFHKKWKEVLETLNFQSELAKATFFHSLRIEHFNTIIKPALEAGKIVITDRWIESTRAYQGTLLDEEERDVLEHILFSDGYFYGFAGEKFLLDTGNYNFLKERVLRRDPEDSFPDFKRFEKIRKAYHEEFVINGSVTKFPYTIIPITEKNGSKRSLESVANDICERLRTIGVKVPN